MTDVRTTKATAAPALSGRDKILPGCDHQTDSCKGPVKLLHGYSDKTPCRIIDDGIIALKTVQHHKVIKIPVDNTGEFCVLFQSADLHAVSGGLKAVAAGSDQYISGIGAVSRNTAVFANLLQGHPFFIIGHDHGKAGSTAFQCLHLHDHRNLCDTSADRFSDLSLFSFHVHQ